MTYQGVVCLREPPISVIKMKIFIGNLSYNVIEGDLRYAFGPYGQVTSANIIRDKQNCKSKGFGFVEMPDRAEAQSAIASLNGMAFKGRTIIQNNKRE